MAVNLTIEKPIRHGQLFIWAKVMQRSQCHAKMTLEKYLDKNAKRLPTSAIRSTAWYMRASLDSCTGLANPTQVFCKTLALSADCLRADLAAFLESSARPCKFRRLVCKFQQVVEPSARSAVLGAASSLTTKHMGRPDLYLTTTRQAVVNPQSQEEPSDAGALPDVKCRQSLTGRSPSVQL